LDEKSPEENFPYLRGFRNHSLIDLNILEESRISRSSLAENVRRSQDQVKVKLQVRKGKKPKPFNCSQIVKDLELGKRLTLADL
jgi:hypothetical protein